MPPRTRGRAPGFRDRTSTRKTGGKKGKKQTHSPKAGQEAGEPAPPTASPREGRRRPHPRRPSEAAQAPGLGPASARRAGRRAPDARGAQGGPPASRFHGTTRTTHTARGRGRAAVGPRAAPALPSAPTPRAWRGAPPRRRAAGVVSLPPTTTRARAFPLGSRRARDGDRHSPPARLPRDRSPAGRAGERPADALRRRPRRRAPPRAEPASPAPEACRTADPAAAGAATPGTAAAASHRRGPSPRARARREGAAAGLSRGATPALLVRTRRPGGEERPRGRPRTPSCAAHTRPRGQGRRRRGDERSPGRDRRRPTAGAVRPTVPAGRDTRRAAPPPLATGSPALAGLRRRRARRALAPPHRRAGRSSQGTAGGRRRRRAAPSRKERPSRGREAPDAPDAAPPRAPETAAAGPGERARAGPGGRRPAAEEGAESARSLPGVARYHEAGGAPLPGAARSTPPAARGGDDDDDGRDGGARPVATGQPPQGIGGSSCSPPLRGAPHGHRPRHTPAAAAAATAAAAAATAGRAEPPESLNRRPAPPAPLSAQPAAFDDAEGKKTWGGPPRRRALGTWPWGEGNDLHGPAGVPPPLPPSGERPPAGARPTSAATTATSFSGPGVSLSSPALRAREDRRGSGRPAGAGDTRARPPSTTSGARARHPARPGTPGGLGPRTSSAAREKGGRSARERDTLPRPAKAPAAPRCGKGRRSRLLRGPEGAPATRLPRPFGQAAREGDGRASGRGRAEHPSLPAPGRPISRATPRREPSSGELGPRRQGGPHARRRPAFGGAGRSGERLGGPRPRAPPLSGGDGPAADRRKAGAAGRCTGQGRGGAQAAATAAGAPRFEARPRRAV
ncbi:collagen alpha-1(I) chain-like [Agelaius tricolor]|uniref:collagen alpha-1(I) chain-like n=1 Tax=Agelaius tricolor TaxID=9191 RepID=UPI0039F1CCC3